MSEAFGMKYRRVLAEVLGQREDSFRAEQRFREDLAADSLDVLEVVIACEAEFDVHLNDAALDQAIECLTVGALANFIESRANPI